MCCRSPAVEKARRCKYEGTRADRHDSRATRVGVADGVQHSRGWIAMDIRGPKRDDCVRVREAFQAMTDIDIEAADNRQ